MSLLLAKNIVKKFPITEGVFRKHIGEKLALDHVSCSVEKGKTLGVVGQSGSGKTTLARILVGLESYDEGEILFEGKHIFSKDHKEAKKERLELRKKLQFVFQNPAVSFNPRASIGAALGEVLIFHKMVKSEQEKIEKMKEILHLVGIHANALFRYPHELSIGQMQRVAIARAFLLEPDLVILDECVSALDILVQAQILNLLLELQQKKGTAYLFITHDLAVVSQVSDHVIVMDEGKVCEEGSTLSLFANPSSSYTKKLLEADLSHLCVF